MQVDRGVVEERVTRELYERVLPLVERERAGLSITAGASLDEQAPFTAGSLWGPPWGTTWFVFTGSIPEHWAGKRVEAIIDLGFRSDAAGFQCEGLIVDGGRLRSEGLIVIHGRLGLDLVIWLSGGQGSQPSLEVLLCRDDDLGPIGRIRGRHFSPFGTSSCGQYTCNSARAL